MDRIQTGGVSNLNIPEEKIYELGNYNTVATVRDIPDLSFDLESLDVSTELEAIALGIDPTTTTAGQEFDFIKSQPMDIISPFKSTQGAFNIVRGIAVPYLNLEQVNYRFGTRANASQQFTFRGDSVFYVPGTPYIESYTGTGTANAASTISNKALTANVATLTTSAAHGFGVGQVVTVAGVDATFNGTYTITAVTATTFSYAKTAANVTSTAATGTATTGAKSFNFTNTALAYVENGVSTYALSVCIYHVDDSYTRLFRGTDYFDTATGISITVPPAATDKIQVVYGSATAATYSAAVHQGTGIKPAAVRGKDIDVYVETASASGIFARWNGVTAFDVSRRVTLENDEEFGNKHYVAQDYNTADVTGTITIRPRDTADLFTKIRQVANIASTTEIVGTFTSSTLAVELRINNPDTGARVKTLYIPDARFTVPAVNGRANQKLDVTFNLTSDGGTLKVYKGARP